MVELAAQLEGAGERERALRAHLHEAHRQLAERDAMIDRLAGTPGATGRERAEREARPEDHVHWDRERGALAEELAAARERLAVVRSTRAWRAAMTWWRWKERLRVG